MNLIAVVQLDVLEIIAMLPAFLQKDATQSTTRIAFPLLTNWMMNLAKSGYLLVLKTTAFLWEKNVLATNPVVVVHLNALEITAMLPASLLRKRFFILLKAGSKPRTIKLKMLHYNIMSLNNSIQPVLFVCVILIKFK